MSFDESAFFLISSEPDEPQPTPAMTPATEADGRRAARILIVEDEYFVALAIEDALIDAGHEVIGVFTSGEEAVDAATRDRPDLVLMDIRLAGDMTGIDAALELRRLGVTCIFATAHSDQASRTSADRAQPAGWLVKPFAQSELVATVAAAILDMKGR